MNPFVYTFGCMLVASIVTMVLMRPSAKKKGKKPGGLRTRLAAAWKILTSKYWLIATESSMGAYGPNEFVASVLDNFNAIHVRKQTNGHPAIDKLIEELKEKEHEHERR